MNTKLSSKTTFAIASGLLCTFKSDTIDFTGNKLVLVTPAGTISGTFISDELEAELEKDVSFGMMKRIYDNASKSCDGAQNVILLRDVSLAGQSCNQFFKYLFVFTEDIIAVSFGDVSSND